MRARGAAGLCGLVALALVSGCSLDSRTLYPAEQSGVGGTAGGGAGGAAGSEVVSKPPPLIELPVCSYSEKVERGCETIVSNAGFSESIEGWEAEPLAIAVEWEAGDATGSDKSGSIAVINSMHGNNDGVAPGGGRQCLPATPQAIYDMAGDVYIPDSQGEGVTGGPYVGQAGLSILFWPNDDCSNKAPSLKSSHTNLMQEVGAWKHVEGTAVAPDGAGSLSIRLLTVKSFKQFNFKAIFDNVLLQER